MFFANERPDRAKRGWPPGPGSPCFLATRQSRAKLYGRPAGALARASSSTPTGSPQARTRAPTQIGRLFSKTARGVQCSRRKPLPPPLLPCPPGLISNLDNPATALASLFWSSAAPGCSFLHSARLQVGKLHLKPGLRASPREPRPLGIRV